MAFSPGKTEDEKVGQIHHFLQLSLDMTSLALSNKKPCLMPVIFHSSPNSCLDPLKGISHLLKDSRTQIFISVLGYVFVW